MLGLTKRGTGWGIRHGGKIGEEIMALKNIAVPLYDSSGEDKNNSLIIDEFAGRIVLKINLYMPKETIIECYWDDIKKAWNTVNKY